MLAIRTCYPLVKDPSGGCFNDRTSLPFQPGIMLSCIGKKGPNLRATIKNAIRMSDYFPRRNFPKGPELLLQARLLSTIWVLAPNVRRSLSEVPAPS